MPGPPATTTAWAMTALAILIGACTSGPCSNRSTLVQEATKMTIQVTSTAFADGQPIPAEFTCDSQDQSPPLQWQGVPAGAQSIVLLVDDPDAPGGTFNHWVVYGLPAAATSLPKGVPRQERLEGGGAQGRNDFGRVGYGGPCPPRGPAHHYQFKVFALGEALSVPAGATKRQVERAMEGKVLDQGRVTGVYQRR